MLITYAGHTWETRGPRPGDPSREAALGELHAIPPLTAASTIASEGWAAFEAGDYAHAVKCAAHAADRAWDYELSP